jgi:hypothetical protein
LTQESQKTELWIARYGLWKLLGAKRSFEKVLGVFVFLSGWKVLAQMTGAFAKFGNFLGIFGVFGPNRNYFSETRGPAVIFPNAQGPR